MPEQETTPNTQQVRVFLDEEIGPDVRKEMVVTSLQPYEIDSLLGVKDTRDYRHQVFEGDTQIIGTPRSGTYIEQMLAHGTNTVAAVRIVRLGENQNRTYRQVHNLDSAS